MVKRKTSKIAEPTRSAHAQGVEKLYPYGHHLTICMRNFQESTNIFYEWALREPKLAFGISGDSDEGCGAGGGSAGTGGGGGGGGLGPSLR